jgi:hypothetical protein
MSDQIAETQGDRLPSEFNKDLMRVDPLTSKSDFDLWSQMVKQILQQHDIEDLIDKTIPRPLPGTQYYPRWRAISKSVATWLINSISKDIFRNVFNSQKLFSFADEAYESIQLTVMGSGLNMVYSTWKRTVSIM